MSEHDVTKEDLIKLANQMLQVRSTIDSDHLKKIFSKISIIDYTALKKVYGNTTEEHISEPIYLTQLAEQFNMTISQVSNQVKRLQTKGYIYWEHDENGTYIRLSETGHRLMQEQQEILNDYFYNVVKRIGYIRFIQLLDNIKKLEEIMDEEACKMIGIPKGSN
ncbi:MAG: MarR family transcriptional regulator [Lachnospiraceae bacterium]|nr:MarR family transcriptional regulator [Lachnospiraceae bacterium]